MQDEGASWRARGVANRNSRSVATTGFVQPVVPMMISAMAVAIPRVWQLATGSDPVVVPVEPAAGSTGWSTAVLPVARESETWRFVEAAMGLAGSTAHGAGSTARLSWAASSSFPPCVAPYL